MTSLLKIILKNALSQNLRVFFVGGIVRDNILNIPTITTKNTIIVNIIDFSINISNNIGINPVIVPNANK